MSYFAPRYEVARTAPERLKKRFQVVVGGACFFGCVLVCDAVAGDQCERDNILVAERALFAGIFSGESGGTLYHHYFGLVQRTPPFKLDRSGP